MMQTDMNCEMTDRKFKSLMIDEGFEPVNRHEHEWEFRISSVPFRRRVKAKVGGWLASHARDEMTRMR